MVREMKSVQPMLKRHGRNVSLPFFVDLWLRNKFDGRDGFSAYILKLILDDLRQDEDFNNEFGTELKQLNLVH